MTGGYRAQMRVGTQRQAGDGIRWRRRPLTMTGFAVAFACYWLLVGLPTEEIQTFLWLWIATVAWNPQLDWRRHLRFARDWSPLLLVLVVYDYSRGLASQLGTPVHYLPQIAADRAMFGTVPTQWLQHRFWSPTDIHWYDVAASFIYFSHFVASMTAAVVLWVRDRVQWVRFTRRLVGLSFAGLTGYILYPAAPPWLAAQNRKLPGFVLRLSSRGWSRIGLHSAGHALERSQAFANPVAAMPSLHGAFALFVVAFFLPFVRRRWWPLLLAYPLLMGVTLVYCGEHYVIDILAGWLTVGLVYLVAARLERRYDRRRGQPPSAGPPGQPARSLVGARPAGAAASSVG